MAAVTWRRSVAAIRAAVSGMYTVRDTSTPRSKHCSREVRVQNVSTRAGCHTTRQLLAAYLACDVVQDGILLGLGGISGLGQVRVEHRGFRRGEDLEVANALNPFGQLLRALPQRRQELRLAYSTGG